MSLFARLFGVRKPAPDMAAGDLSVHLLRMAMSVETGLGIKDSNPNKSGIAMQEVLFAYLNVADRSLFGLFGPAIRDKAMEQLDELLPSSITEALCSSWPDDLKSKHVEEFAANLRSAEAEYGNLQMLGKPDPDDLFMRCALNVLAHIGYPNDLERGLPLCLCIMKTYTDMPMSPFVRSLGDSLQGQ